MKPVRKITWCTGWIFLISIFPLLGQPEIPYEDIETRITGRVHRAPFPYSWTDYDYKVQAVYTNSLSEEELRNLRQAGITNLDNGLLIWEGDIIIGRVDMDFRDVWLEGLNRTEMTQRLWPGGRIPYVLTEHRADTVIREAMRIMQSSSPLQFVAKTSGDQDYIDFVGPDVPGCAVEGIGRMGGRQRVFVGYNASVGNVLHLLGHVAGLLHEHNRADRDNFIRIYPENIKEDWRDVYQIHVDIERFGIEMGDYDFLSIMHAVPYSSMVCADISKRIFTRRNGQMAYAGYRDECISSGDEEKLRSLYSRVLGVDSTAARQTIDVRYQVELMGDLHDISCWGAAAAMVVAWRDNVFLNPLEVVMGTGNWQNFSHCRNYEFNEAYARRYFILGPERAENPGYVETWTLYPESFSSITVQDLARLLERFGPLCVAFGADFNSPESGHVRVITGIRGDGTSAGTTLMITDPWNHRVSRVDPRRFQGLSYEIPYQDVESKLRGAGSGASAGSSIQATIFLAHL